MYFYNPESQSFWRLVGDAADQRFTPVTRLNLPWTSPLLNIRFELFEDGLGVFHPDGDRLKDPDEVRQERDQIQQKRDRALAKLRELGLDPSQQ